VSAVADADLAFAAPPARRPGTPARFLLLLLAAAGSAAVLAVGFPRGAPDRLPVLLLSLVLAVAAVFRREAAIRAFCFLLPLAGLLARSSGGTDPVAWPVLLFGGLAAGWTFRFLYDFESVPEPSRLDSPLKALLAVWAIGTVVALAHARTLWALANGLTGRAVNGEGLPETAAIRESVLAFAILGAGAAFFFLLRRSGEAARAAATRAALAGSAVSAAAALLQAAGALPGEARPFWKLTGRLSGGATDPNALGLLCGLGIVALLGLTIARHGKGWTLAMLLPLPVGLVLSGSRSGFLIALLGVAVLLVAARARGRGRLAIAASGLVAVSLLALVLFRGSPGSVGERLVRIFEPGIPLAARASSRPVLWNAAAQLFRDSPLEGGGLGAFSWRLPELASEPVEMRDNPGSAYLQALAETGILGFLVMLAFAFSLVWQAAGRVREAASDAAAAGAALAVMAFLVALVVGSHWLAPEVSLLFFLLCAGVAAPDEKRAGIASRVRLGLVLLYAAAALYAVVATGKAEETFRHGRRVGFHARETGPGGPFRWTRRRFAVWVTRTEPERISLRNHSPEGRPVELTVRAEGPAIYRRSIAPGETVSFALWAGGRDRALRFELDHAFVPKRFGLPDRRELGLLAVLPEER